MARRMVYHDPPMRFDVGKRQFVPDLPIKYEKVTNPTSDKENGKIFLFLILILLLIFLYFFLYNTFKLS